MSPPSVSRGQVDLSGRRVNAGSEEEVAQFNGSDGSFLSVSDSGGNLPFSPSASPVSRPSGYVVKG